MLRHVLVPLLALSIALPSLAKEKGQSADPRSGGIKGTVPAMTASDWADRCDRPADRAEINRLLAECRKTSCFRGLDVAGCRDILRTGGSRSACERARCELLVACLNRGSGRGSGDRCGDWDDYRRHCTGGPRTHDCADHGGSGGDRDGCGEHSGSHDGCDRHRNTQGLGHQKAKGKGHRCD